MPTTTLRLLWVGSAFEEQFPYGPQGITAVAQSLYQFNSFNAFFVEQASSGRRNFCGLKQTDHEVILQRLPRNASLFCG
jgi:hypothetical protein